MLKINGVSADEVLAEATDLYSRWPTFERELKRRVVESITEKIVIAKDEVSRGERMLRGMRFVSVDQILGQVAIAPRS